jgi:hypothetical protein
MRETPMRRGALSPRARRLKCQVARSIAARSAPSALAQRVAFQLVFKFDRRELFGEAEWRAIGNILRQDTSRLKAQLGMSDRRIVAALPKLSATQILEFLHELEETDQQIARTILHAAVCTADPLTTGRRYLAEYRLVARTLNALDPTMARTVAAATFSAAAPLHKAMEHLERFSSLLAKYQDTPHLARRLARAGFRAKPVTETGVSP